MSDLDKFEQFEKTLTEKYPLMFANPYGGICVDEGWWPILESLCRQIQSHIDWRQEQKEKYNRGEGCNQVVVMQIKEKFGGLRFYYDGGDSTIDGMVRMAESWAAHSCEVCGHPGERRSGGWIKNLCDEHHREREARYKEQGLA